MPPAGAFAPFFLYSFPLSHTNVERSAILDVLLPAPITMILPPSDTTVTPGPKLSVTELITQDKNLRHGFPICSMYPFECDKAPIRSLTGILASHCKSSVEYIDYGVYLVDLEVPFCYLNTEAVHQYRDVLPYIYHFLQPHKVSTLLHPNSG